MAGPNVVPNVVPVGLMVLPGTHQLVLESEWGQVGLVGLLIAPGDLIAQATRAVCNPMVHVQPLTEQIVALEGHFRSEKNGIGEEGLSFVHTKVPVQIGPHILTDNLSG